MDRVENIKSINIDLGSLIKLEIIRDNEIEVIAFDYEDTARRDALNTFLRIFNLVSKVKVGVVKEWIKWKKKYLK